MKKEFNMSTLKEVVSVILGNTDNEVLREMFHSEISENTKWDSVDVTTFRESLKKEGITLKHEDNYGGEDMGSEYWSVYSFEKSGAIIYVKFDGYYYSYNGSTFDEWYFCKPVPKQGFDFVKES